MSEDKLALKLGSRVALMNAVRKEKNKITTAYDKINGLTDPIFEQMGLLPIGMQVGEWECEDSPFGFCAYERFEDPAYDNCVFCHQPHERK